MFSVSRCCWKCFCKVTGSRQPQEQSHLPGSRAAAWAQGPEHTEQRSHVSVSSEHDAVGRLISALSSCFN